MKVLYFPQWRGSMLKDRWTVAADRQELEARTGPNAFACAECHHVNFSRCWSNSGWKKMIAYLSGGLLYGREVQTPAALVQQRRCKFAPQPNRAPSRRRTQVLERLLKGWTNDQIAADLGIAYNTVRRWIAMIYRAHGVRGGPGPAGRAAAVKLLAQSVVESGRRVPELGSPAVPSPTCNDAAAHFRSSNCSPSSASSRS